MEKKALSSKKFLAFLFAEAGFFVLMGMMLYLQEIDKVGENLAFMVLAVTAGFIATGLILGQGSLDRYVRVAMIMAGKGDVGKVEPVEEEKKG